MGHCWSHTNPSHTAATTDKNMDGCTRARVVVTNALSPIGLATVQSLHTNFPQYHIRAGIPSTATPHQLEPLAACDVDPVYLNTSKRQSLIWSLVGVQSLLIIPSADDRLHTTLSYIAAAKTAGVKLITVVSTPTRNADGILSYSSTPNVVERAVLKTKLGCCFVRLPFVIEDGKMNTGKFNSACLIDGVHHSHLASISLTDVGSACAAILANYQEHLFTRYDLFTSDKDKKKPPPPTVHSEKSPATPPTGTVQHNHVMGTSATQSPCTSQSSDSSQPTSQTSTPSPRTRALSQEVGQGTLVGTETLVGAE